MIQYLLPNVQPRPAQPLLKEVQDYIYRPEDQIGVGQFSKVYKGVNQITNEHVAIKVVELKSITDPIFHLMTNNEISVLKLISPNPNLMKLHEVLQTVNNIYIITELCNQGDLAKLLSRCGRIPEARAMEIFQNLLNGFQELKNKSIIHRDVKPANILFNSETPKLADFGFSVSKHLQSEEQRKLELYNVGTPLYMSPETILRNIYTLKSDMWSLGVVLYEMIYGIVPFNTDKEEELKAILQRHQMKSQIHFPPEVPISPVTMGIIMGLLQYDLNRRYGVEECVASLSQQLTSRSLIPLPVNPLPVNPPTSICLMNMSDENTYPIPIYVNGKRKISNGKPDVPLLNKADYMYSHHQQRSPPHTTSNQYNPAQNQVCFNRYQLRDNRNKENITQQYLMVNQTELIQPARSSPTQNQSPLRRKGHTTPVKQSPSSLINIQLNPKVQDQVSTSGSDTESFEYLLHFSKFIHRVITLLIKDQILKIERNNYRDPVLKNLSDKLKYSLLKDCKEKLQNYQVNTGKPLPREFKEIFNEYAKLDYDRDRLRDDGDQIFLAILNYGQKITDIVNSPVYIYLKTGIQQLYASLEFLLQKVNDEDPITDATKSSIILLDYMVTLLMLYKLAHDCGGDSSMFQKQSQIEQISQVKIADQITRKHFTRVGFKIKIQNLF